jgi:threonylcarbamoyladenosine tRNA methylthiotransferase MtaB
MPHAFIGADVIAGFPGETEQEFAETVRLLEELPVSDLHVFPYSKRSGTRAADMSGQVAANVIKERAERLRGIAAAKKTAFLEKNLGRELQVLVQGHDRKTGLCRGLARNYVTVEFAGDGNMLNQELVVRAEQAGTHADLLGVAIK